MVDASITNHAIAFGSKVKETAQNNPKRILTIIIVLGIISLIAIVLTVVFGVEAHDAKNKTIILGGTVSSLNKKTIDLKNQISTVMNHQKTAQQMLNLNEGKRGPSGPQGPVGGVYKEKGYLHNVKHGPNMAVDRYYANGTESKAFINSKTFGSTSQKWTLTNDNVLENEYGGCMYADDNNNVYMMNNCKDGTGKGQWITDKKGGKLMWKFKPHKCLAVGRKTRSTAHTIKNGKPTQGSTSFAMLKLQECDQNNPDHQIWTFS